MIGIVQDGHLPTDKSISEVDEFGLILLVVVLWKTNSESHKLWESFSMLLDCYAILEVVLWTD